jgi:hypothetical protein
MSATAYHQKAKAREPFQRSGFMWYYGNAHFFQLVLLPRSNINFGSVSCESGCHHLSNTRSSTSNENFVGGRLKGAEMNNKFNHTNLAFDPEEWVQPEVWYYWVYVLKLYQVYTHHWTFYNLINYFWQSRKRCVELRVCWESGGDGYIEYSCFGIGYWRLPDNRLPDMDIVIDLKTRKQNLSQ